MDITHDRKMITRGLEVLAESEDVGALGGKVFDRPENFVPFFAEAEHQAGFSGHIGMSLFGALEKFKRALVEGTFADVAVEAGNGFGVVIENVGLHRKHRIERVPVAAKIGDQDFNFAAGNPAANFGDGAGENGGAAIGLIVAIDAGDDGIAEAHAGDGFGDAQRFFFIRRADRLARRNCTETACAGANITQNHESGGAVLPAFAHVGAARGFADGVEIESAHGAFEILVALAAEEFDAEPIRARVSVGRGHRKRPGVGDNVEGGGH